MRNVAAPAATILSSLGKIDMLDDSGWVVREVEFDSLDYSVAAPQALDHFAELARARAGNFANGFGEFKQFSGLDWNRCVVNRRVSENEVRCRFARANASVFHCALPET